MDYQEIIEQIAAGAQKLQLCIRDDELAQPFVESSEPFVRIPVSAYCLKLAHEIWCQTQLPHPQMPYQGLIGPFPMGTMTIPDPKKELNFDNVQEALDKMLDQQKQIKEAAEKKNKRKEE